MTDYAIRVGDRVQTTSYGTGTVSSIERPRTGENIYWIKLDDPRHSRFGSYKTHSGNLTKLTAPAAT